MCLSSNMSLFNQTFEYGPYKILIRWMIKNCNYMRYFPNVIQNFDDIFKVLKRITCIQSVLETVYDSICKYTAWVLTCFYIYLDCAYLTALTNSQPGRWELNDQSKTWWKSGNCYSVGRRHEMTGFAVIIFKSYGELLLVQG